MTQSYIPKNEWLGSQACFKPKRQKKAFFSAKGSLTTITTNKTIYYAKIMHV